MCVCNKKVRFKSIGCWSWEANGDLHQWDFLCELLTHSFFNLLSFYHTHTHTHKYIHTYIHRPCSGLALLVIYSCCCFITFISDPPPCFFFSRNVSLCILESGAYFHCMHTYTHTFIHRPCSGLALLVIYSCCLPLPPSLL